MIFIVLIFVLLSAAIRWGWRATALTATLLTLLYLIAGLLVATLSTDFELQRFVVRDRDEAIDEAVPFDGVAELWVETLDALAWIWPSITDADLRALADQLIVQNAQLKDRLAQ